ncbi:MAG: LysE family translocator [Pseudomonadota bacterium]
MSAADCLSLALLCLAGAASPGPSLAVVLNACFQNGRRGGLVASWSHAAGVGLYAAITAFGISTLITTASSLLKGMQMLGAGYLLWMAWRLWSENGTLSEAKGEFVKKSQAMRDGFAVAFLNPKLAIFMLALFSQFIRVDAGPTVKFQMTGIAWLVDGLWYTTVTLLFTRSGFLDWLRGHAVLINRIFAIALGLLALSLVVSLVLGS